MKICFFAPSNSAHTKKWCDYFVSCGHEVHVISFSEDNIDGVHLHYIQTGANAGGSDAQKLKYLTKVRQVRKIIKELAPDIINVHYATSYGTVAALAGIKKYILSVWGSDIYEFPQKSPLHRLLLKFSLAKAGYLFSTSRAMAEEAAKYTKKPFFLTPFGVDVNLFSPEKRNRNNEDFVVGTVKSLSPTYGIDVLLNSVAIVRTEHPEIPLKLRIAGKGPCQEEYHQLASTLRIDDITAWLGFISQEQAATEWANMDVAVIPSNSESFGVSAVEAQSCGCPVIVSNVPGLMEATIPEQTSIVVPKKDERAVAEAIVKLYADGSFRNQMGLAGRDYVVNNYEINSCFRKIEEFYFDLTNN